MEYQKTTLKNGIRILYVPIPAVESATVMVWIRCGSRFEEGRVSGISHFLEHVVFKGSQKRPSAKAISEAIDSLGCEFNAGTSKEWTHFYVKARASAMPKAVDILADMVLHPLLRPEDIAREKGVILEEISLYEDTPIYKINDLFENLIYAQSPLGWDISGTPETVKKIKKDDFVKYRSKYYYPGNMVITVAGAVSKSDAFGSAEKYFGGLERSSQVQEKPKLTFKQTLPQVSLKKKKVDQAHVILGFRGDPMGESRRFVESVLTSILGGGMSSRLFTEVREKRGLAYSVKTSSEHYLDNGYFSTYAGLDTERVSEAIKVMLEVHYGLVTKKYPLTPREFNKAKEYLKGNIALSLEDTKNVDLFFGLEELMLGKPLSPEEVFNAIDKVTIDEVYHLAKDFFKPEKLNLAIIGPYTDRQKFEKAVE